MCLSTCPDNYVSNGTHCIDVMTVSLTTSSAFPVPFSIAAAVCVIACLMSRLQYSQTFISGAIFSLLSILEWGAVLFYIYLYYSAFPNDLIPLFIALGSIGFLYFLNLIAMISQSIFLSY
jgi:hypothetical protein